MNCAYHPDQPVQGICSTCGRPICASCLVDLRGQVHCKACLEARMRKPPREVIGFFRFVFSACPGLGHLYMGMMQRGFQLLVGGVLGSILIGMIFPPLLGLYIPALIFYSIFDAREAHLRIAQGLEVEDKGFIDLKNWKMTWNPRYVGYGLIGIGLLAFYNVMLDDLLYVFFRNSAVYGKIVDAANGTLLGLLAIGAGLWMLRGNFGKSHQ